MLSSVEGQAQAPGRLLPASLHSRSPGRRFLLKEGGRLAILSHTSRVGLWDGLQYGDWVVVGGTWAVYATQPSPEPETKKDVSSCRLLTEIEQESLL